MDEQMRQSIAEKTGLRLGRTANDHRQFWIEFSGRAGMVLAAVAMLLLGLKICAAIGGSGWTLMLPVVAACYWLCRTAGVTEEGLSATFGLLGLLGIIVGLIFGFTTEFTRY